MIISTLHRYRSNQVTGPKSGQRHVNDEIKRWYHSVSGWFSLSFFLLLWPTGPNSRRGKKQNADYNVVTSIVGFDSTNQPLRLVLSSGVCGTPKIYFYRDFVSSLALLNKHGSGNCLTLWWICFWCTILLEASVWIVYRWGKVLTENKSLKEPISKLQQNFVKSLLLAINIEVDGVIKLHKGVGLSV